MSEYAFPITSEEADRLPVDYSLPLLRGLLARGEVTIRAIAVRYFAGDVEAAKAGMYPPMHLPRRRPHESAATT